METKLWNIPNVLTISRFLFSPLFLYFFLVDKIELALIVFMFVAVTDLADGWIARSTNQKTKFGESLDPMADKFMIFLALVAVCIKFSFPVWAIPLFISRDIISLAGSILIYTKHKGVWKANKLGKLTTFLQIVSILVFILNMSFKMIVLWITIISSITAAIAYLIRWINIARNKTKP